MQESSAVDSVLNAMLSIGRLMRQRSGSEALEPGTFWLLNSLRCTGEMRVTELASKLLLDASTVSRHVQQLEKAGLVERTTDPQDKRAQIVGLSADGRGILEAGLARRKATLVEHFTDWDQHDVDTLERLLNKLVQTIEKSDGSQPGLTNTTSTTDNSTDRPVAELEHQ